MNKKTKAHCNTCLGERNHEVLFAETTSWFHDEAGFGGRDQYEMLKCRGCDSVILRHSSWFSEDRPANASVHYYPPATCRKEPAWLLDMSGKGAQFARSLLGEIYIGMQNGMKMLTAMGIRSLMEYVMIDSVGDHESFGKNLAEFASKGFISQKQRSILDVVLDAGHAATHRSYKPTDADLATSVDIAETVIQTVYVHPDKAAELKERVPKRKPKRK